jgi:hypothetical protein
MLLMERFAHSRLTALALALALLALALSGPPCAEPASCPMDQTPAAASCDGLSADCCQAAAERTAGAPALPSLGPAAAPACGAPRTAAAAAPALARTAPAELDEPPPLAALQGIGLHALLSVFLI